MEDERDLRPVEEQGAEEEEEMEDVPEGAADVGQLLLSWEVDEYPRVTRSRRWYVIASLVGLALVIYAIATANFLFAVIVLAAGVMYLTTSFTSPRRIPVVVTDLGLLIDDRFYEYKDLRDFSVAYRPPDVKLLYVDFVSPLSPLLPIPLEETDPNEVREALLPFCYENLERTEETLTDRLRRVYKL